MLENENYWKSPSIYEYNTMYSTVSCWILGEHGNREWVSNGGEGIQLKHDIYRPEVPKPNLLGPSIYTFS
jgi:hypothetical protein